ncbi:MULTISPECIES: SEC-C metal-binding domain-containing protein [Geobacillus]|nr:MULTISPECIES: SEC-C metal-binding domain-containing protein [Geobacillus]MED3664731.1 SEC-C metal-binding domain-containing protein [Geobacillus stearothermophilus]MED3720168.1 SEC-C metal-binding domain-containing protein [Geobacillus stearothermophilus]MED3757297.1 SEC-C metal-binding domain-containing protein [Geobacillus stearothermophilus]MED3785403.1 SEC-C metal-binding domain-containing protein [Geobacillus stearothermophilus]MED4869726.1 SEC-C metal-binding domain-containing protein
MSIGWNDPCPCGSRKKYKKCCMNKQQNRQLPPLS